jgi:hypothetical protein
MSITVKTGWLKDSNGDKFAPKTLASQVQTDDGTLLEDKIQSDINIIKNEINAGVAAETERATGVEGGLDTRVTNLETMAASKADWNQNDTNAIDYVKNRTHYEEVVNQPYVLVKDLEAGDTPDGNLFLSNGLERGFLPGDVLEITLRDSIFQHDDLTYIGTVEDDGSDIYAGDTINFLWPAELDLTPPHYLEPLLCYIDYNGKFAIQLNCSDFRKLTIRLLNVTQEETIIHKLDSKYLDNPDWNAKEGEAGYIENKPFYDETTSGPLVIAEGPYTGETSDGIYFEWKNLPRGFVAGERVTVILGDSPDAEDPVVFTGTAVKNEGQSTDDLSVYYVPTNWQENWIFGLGCQINSDGIVEYLSLDAEYRYAKIILPDVIEEKTTIHHLDPKYIKDMYYDNRHGVKTEEKTVNGTIITDSLLKVADSVDFDINRVTSLSLRTSAGVEITDAPVLIVTDECGTALVTNTAEYGEYWSFAYFATQEEADNHWGDDEEENPFGVGLYAHVYDFENDADLEAGENAEITYSFTVEAGNLHQIDNKYIKDMYYEERSITASYLEETTIAGFVDDEDGIYTTWLESPLSITGQFELGKQYKILWDGIEYLAEYCETEGGYYFGHDYYVSAWETDLPFGIWIGLDGTIDALSANSYENSHTFSIYEGSYYIHKIDPKYLPDSLATVDDVQEGLDALYNELAVEIDATKMDKADPAGTGTFSMNRKSGTTIGVNSVAVGYETEASGDYSYAEGHNTKATTNSSAKGVYSAAGNNHVHATAGYATHAEGYGTVASGIASHAEGDGSTASGNGSHAEGGLTTASGSMSHAEGWTTIASESYSHAEGAFTKAHGTCSHAEGNYTEARGNLSHVEGNYTFANSRLQHVQGEYNILDTEGTATTRGKYAHIVGNGTSDRARSNAHTLDWSGNAWFAGDVYVGSTSGVNKDEGSKKLLTEGQIATYEDIMDLLSEIGAIDPVTTSDGSILTSQTGEIYTL